jgi:hypothetical protein
MREMKMKTGELFPGVLAENTACVFLARLDPDNPVHWAKSIVGYANGRGGTLFVGVSDSGEASGIGIREIDRAKSLIAAVNEGDLNGTADVNGAENDPAAVPAGKASGNEITEIKYAHDKWTEYISLCRQYRTDLSAPSLKELKNQEIVSKDGHAKSGFVMFSDNYDGDNSLICCRLWKGKKKLASPLPAKGFRDLLLGFLPKIWPLSKGTPEPDGAKQTGAAGKRYGHILKGRYGQPWLMP